MNLQSYMWIMILGCILIVEIWEHVCVCVCVVCPTGTVWLHRVCVPVPTCAQPEGCRAPVSSSLAQVHGPEKPSLWVFPLSSDPRDCCWCWGHRGEGGRIRPIWKPHHSPSSCRGNQWCTSCQGRHLRAGLTSESHSWGRSKEGARAPGRGWG